MPTNRHFPILPDQQAAQPSVTPVALLVTGVICIWLALRDLWERSRTLFSSYTPIKS